MLLLLLLLLILVLLILTQGFSFIDFRETGRGRERKKNQCEREALISCLSQVPRMGIEPAT